MQCGPIRAGLAASVFALVAPAVCPAGSRLPLTPQAAIETTRFMVDPGNATANDPAGVVSMSPGGHWWVARLVRGDVERNGLWMEMLVGDARSFGKAGNARTVARLFSTGLGDGEGRAGANQDGLAEATPLQWLDDDTVAFPWSDELGRRQVMRVNVRTGTVEKLTAHEHGVATFDVAAEGTVVFSAPVPMPESDLDASLRRGFIVGPETDAASLIQGYVNHGSLVDRLWQTRWFVQRAGRAAMPIRVAGRDVDPNPYERVWLSRQGRWGLIAAVASEVPPEWSRYGDPNMATRVRRAHENPRSMLGRLVYQFHVLDTATGVAEPLWSAPTNADSVRCAWSPDEREIAIAPAFLPLGAQVDEAGLMGRGVAIVQRETASYELLPVDLTGQSVKAIRWENAGSVSLHLREDGRDLTISFERVKGRWQRIESGTVAKARVHFELRQSLDSPPVLFIRDPASRRSRRLIDPNPDLADRYDLGRAAHRSGSLDETTRWHGLVFYPPAFDPSRRYPLVIQSVYGSRSSDDFTLYGWGGGFGLGPTPIPPYPGRVLAQAGIVVLQMDIERDRTRATPAEGPLRQRAFEQAIAALAKEGYVDADSVGLLGFSRNGYFVEFAISHSKFPFRAAVAADHFDAGYVAQTLLGYNSGAADVNGGQPFGAGLQHWLGQAPGFNAEHIRTPLLQIEQSRGVLGAVLRWETFARLRFLRKPVELWVIPNAQFGVHNAQNPEQILAQQERVIDWFRFWLQSEEDARPEKQDQYLRWRELREAAGKAGSE
jgi:hypothetical protein